MELTTKDPDPYFFGSYNWYYTGGTLEIASIFDVDFLFYVSGEKLNIFSKYCDCKIKKKRHIKTKEKLSYFRFQPINVKQRLPSSRTFG